MAAVFDRMRSLRVADVMHREVVPIHTYQTMAEAARVLAEHQISGAPVLDEQGHCVGILSANDFVSHAKSARDLVSTVSACEKSLARETPSGPWLVSNVFDDRVAACMTSAVQSVDASASLVEAGRIMSAQHIHRLPVLDDRGHLLGMVTSLDIVTALVNATDEAGQKADNAHRIASRGARQADSLKPPPATAIELQHEHAGVRSRIDEVRTAIASEKDQTRLVAAIRKFTGELDDHFHQRNQRLLPASRCAGLGWRTKLPPYWPNIQGFASRWREIIRLVPDLANRVTMAQKFEGFVNLWVAHETAENDLLIDAYNQDLGPED